MTLQEHNKHEETVHRLIKDLYPNDAVQFEVIYNCRASKATWALKDPSGCFAKGTEANMSLAYQGLINYLQEKAED